MPTSARDFISDKIANIVQNISFRINFVWGDVGIAPYGLSRCKHLDKLKFEQQVSPQNPQVSVGLG
jgi:hypothetical protein